MVNLFTVSVLPQFYSVIYFCRYSNVQLTTAPNSSLDLKADENNPENTTTGCTASKDGRDHRNKQATAGDDNESVHSHADGDRNAPHSASEHQVKKMKTDNRTLHSKKDNNAFGSQKNTK